MFNDSKSPETPLSRAVEAGRAVAKYLTELGVQGQIGRGIGGSYPTFSTKIVLPKGYQKTDDYPQEYDGIKIDYYFS